MSKRLMSSPNNKLIIKKIIPYICSRTINNKKTAHIIEEQRKIVNEGQFVLEALVLPEIKNYSIYKHIISELKKRWL